MDDVQDEIELRSEEVQEMLGKTPNWMTMWGASIILGIIVIFLILAWFIRYPDVLLGELRLTTLNPSVKLYARTSGKIQKLYIPNLKKVREGTLIAELENPVTLESIKYLKTLTEDIRKNIGQSNRFFIAPSLYTFGEAQTDYNFLIENIENYNNLLDNPHYKQRISNLKEQIKLYKQLVNVSENQVALFKKQLQNANKKFEIDEFLQKEKVYSKTEFIQQEDAFTGKLMEYENYKKGIIQNKITIAENEKQLKDLEFDFQEKQRLYRLGINQSLQKLESFVKNWQQGNVISAPIAGTVSYLKPFVENQYIHIDDELFAIVPETEAYVGYAIVSAKGAGKIKKGQKVHITFDSYPYEQFGKVLGRVADISLLPEGETKSGAPSYRVTVELTKGLETSYNKKLGFSPDMTGSVEIVTEELRVLERVFYGIKKLLDYSSR